MADFRPLRILVVGSVLLSVLMTFMGCAGSGGNTKSPEGGDSAASSGAQTAIPLYYDFEDVLIPSELKVDKKRSFVYFAPTFRAGLLVLKGRVETNSLIRFFENNMAKDNWRLVSSFKANRTIMFFNKPNRSCIISITQKTFSSEVEIWVAPTLEFSEETLLK
ncbi:MAG: hypothetical protein JRI47_00690 [Deltaproteobacteria bacterium]|nr:hypothetical protein [Deltaproteobacteria bacterium]